MKKRSKSKFYKDSIFYSTDEVTDLLIKAGFKKFQYKQTLFNNENVIQEYKDGYDKVSFIVIKAEKLV